MESERLLFNVLSIEDHEYFHEIVTHPFGRQYLFDDLILSKEESEEILRTNQRHFKEKSLGLWKIVEKETLKPVGVVGLWFFFEEPQAQLLYILSSEYAGNGYATEGSAEVINYAFSYLNYEYIDASIDLPNTNSKKVCERLGMVKFKELNWEGKDILFYRLKKDKNFAM